jgi:hypothetical protein
MSSGLLRLVVWYKLTDFSEMLTASIIRAICCVGQFPQGYISHQHISHKTSYYPPWEPGISENAIFHYQPPQNIKMLFTSTSYVTLKNCSNSKYSRLLFESFPSLYTDTSWIDYYWYWLDRDRTNTRMKVCGNGRNPRKLPQNRGGSLTINYKIQTSHFAFESYTLNVSLKEELLVTQSH